MNVPFVDLGRQYAALKDEVDAALLRAVASTQYILGEEVDLFEAEFGSYLDVDHCVGVASGTAALGLAFEALDLGRGDEVIAPANTFIATVLPLLKLGARPILVDCDPDTATINVDAAAAAIGPRTKAVIAVHLYGQPANLDPLRRVCEGNGLALIEDACQAHGARYKGRRVGGLGDVAAFSFYPAKNLGAYGDAGAITTRDAELARRVRLLRNLGEERKYVHLSAGSNERLDTLQAAVLRVKLRRLDSWNTRRRRHADLYAELLAAAPVQAPVTAPWAEHVWHLYVVRMNERDRVRDELRAAGIATGLHYPTPLHLQPPLEYLGYQAGEFPVAEKWTESMLSLPMFAELEPAEVHHVAEAIERATRDAPAIDLSRLAREAGRVRESR